MSKKFTELNAGTIGAGSIFAQAQEPALSGDPYTSTKVSATQIANYVAKGQAFPELNNQTIIQAITGGSGAGTVILTMAQYIALTPAQQTDGHIYVISDYACIFCYGRQYRAMKELERAQYDQLSPAEQNNGTLYIITDEETTATDIPYSAGVSVADKIDGLKTTDINAVKGSFSGIKGVYGGYISGSKNYFDFFIPCNTNGLTTITNVSFTSISVLTANGRSDNPFSSYSVDVTPMGLFFDCRYSSTQAASISGVVTFDGLAFMAN